MPSVDPDSTLRRCLSECLVNGRYSDLRIKDSNGHEYAVHRVIVCGQSPVLAKAVKPEHGFKEALTGVISLEHDDPRAVKSMLEFLYLGSYANVGDDDDAVMTHTARVYALGEIYSIQDLKDYAVAEFDDLSPTHWAKTDFADAVKAIYSSIPDTDSDEMRFIITTTVTDNYQDLIVKPHFVSLLEEFGELGRDILRRLSNRHSARLPPPQRYYCDTESASDKKHHTFYMFIDHLEPFRYTFCQVCGKGRLNKEWANLEVPIAS